MQLTRLVFFGSASVYIGLFVRGLNLVLFTQDIWTPRTGFISTSSDIWTDGELGVVLMLRTSVSSWSDVRKVLVSWEEGRGEWEGSWDYQIGLINQQIALRSQKWISESWWVEPNLDYNYIISTGLASNRIQLGKSHLVRIFNPNIWRENKKIFLKIFKSRTNKNAKSWPSGTQTLVLGSL